MKYPRPVVPDDLNRTIRRAGEVCCLLAQSVAVAISQRDVELAQNSFAIDDELDLIHREMFALMLGPSWNKEVGTTVDITLLSRFYERFGDHAVSVAKRLIHIVTGQSFADSVNPM